MYDSVKHSSAEDITQKMADTLKVKSKSQYFSFDLLAGIIFL